MKIWQENLERCFRSMDELGPVLGIPEDELKRLREIGERYPVCVPEYYLNLIDRNDRHDPIRKMCIPDLIEFSEGGSMDTSGEGENTVMQGMQHKYRQTVLILSTNQCAMYCRHCFRKRLVGLSSEEIAKRIPEMAEYVRSHPEINNILISGGDSFLCSNEVIRHYLETFSMIPNLEFIRFGTRTPVTFPERITGDDGELLSILREALKRIAIMVVTQFNHPRELTDESRKAVRSLIEAGCTVRNQTVLLKGVNDDPETLSSLMNGLVSISVSPYYLFQCRPVEGVKNQFQVPIRRGAAIVDEAKRRMSGPGKAFRYAMSHPTGKIEILGEYDERMLFRYHQAKDERDNARIFTRPLSDTECWFSDPDGC